MTLGFTGTQLGMTQRQAATVKYLFAELQLGTLHHGLCVGADAQAHNIALAFRARIVGHPPSDKKLMAGNLTCDELRDPLPYLDRNDAIVAEGIDGLIAAPRGKVEQFRSGTWATIRRGRKAMKADPTRRLWIVWHDGTFAEEQ